LACKFNFIDSAIALNGAFFINAAILILAGSVFYTNGRVVTDIVQAHELLTPLLGTAMASILFAIALLASGQSSTITGTLAGQIVMEGFLHLKINPAMRRFITRALAVIPAALVLAIMGESSTIDLLILSQVILSMQLSFAVIPLIRFTSNKQIMGEFVNKLWVKVLAWLTAAIVLSLNIKLLVDKELEALSAEGTSHTIGIIALPFLLGIFVLLIYILVKTPSHPEVIKAIPSGTAPLPATPFKRVGVAIEAGEQDAKLISQALRLSSDGAEIILIHIASSASGFFNRERSRDAAVVSGEKYLASLVNKYNSENITISSKLGYGPISDELIRIAKEEKLDLLVLGSHKHRGLKDLFFGATVSPVRHALDIPIFIVQ
jgi:manganese transport protein